MNCAKHPYPCAECTQSLRDRLQAAELQIERLTSDNESLRRAHQTEVDNTNKVVDQLNEKNRLNGEATQVIRDILANELIHSEALLARARAVVAEKRAAGSPKEAEKAVQEIYPTLKALSDDERKIAFDGLWGMFCRTCYRLLDEGRKCHCWNDE